MKEQLVGFAQAAVLVLACLGLLHCTGCATQAEPGICMSPQVMARCELEGGCALFSRAGFEQAVAEIVEKSCKGRT